MVIGWRFLAGLRNDGIAAGMLEPIRGCSKKVRGWFAPSLVQGHAFDCLAYRCGQNPPLRPNLWPQPIHWRRGEGVVRQSWAHCKHVLRMSTPSATPTLFVALLVFLLLCLGASAQSQNYRVSKGDTLEVTVWQDSNINRRLLVTPDGFVSMPLGGSVHAAGLPLSAIEKEITARLQPNYKVPLTVTVAVVGHDSSHNDQFFVFVTGEVNDPGRYPLDVDNPLDTLQAIALAGGFGRFASQKRIEVHRKVRGEVVTHRFNFRRYRKGKDTENNITVRHGDVVFVPERGLFE